MIIHDHTINRGLSWIYPVLEWSIILYMTIIIYPVLGMITIQWGIPWIRLWIPLTRQVESRAYHEPRWTRRIQAWMNNMIQSLD